MIRFDLVCAKEHAFEGWFRNGDAYDEQASGSLLSCPYCGDKAVRKALMAPAIARHRQAPAAPPAPEPAPAPPASETPAPPADPRRAAFVEAVRLLRQVQTFVERNFDHVGDRFPEEARKIHHGESEDRPIWGQATPDEAEALAEEGITVRQLPRLPKLDG